jgi:uncharacterized protein DUF4845
MKLGGQMRKQRGVTMIGWIFLLTPVAIVLYGAIRVTPEYLGYYKLVSAMKETASQLKSDETLDAKTITRALERRFDTGYVEAVNAEDIVVVKDDNGWSMTAEYEETAPLFGNLGLVMSFKKTVAIE